MTCRKTSFVREKSSVSPCGADRVYDVIEDKACKKAGQASKEREGPPVDKRRPEHSGRYDVKAVFPKKKDKERKNHDGTDHPVS